MNAKIEKRIRRTYLREVQDAAREAARSGAIRKVQEEIGAEVREFAQTMKHRLDFWKRVAVSSWIVMILQGFAGIAWFLFSK